jgi:hypothetical protein
MKTCTRYNNFYNIKALIRAVTNINERIHLFFALKLFRLLVPLFRWQRFEVVVSLL